MEGGTIEIDEERDLLVGLVLRSGDRREVGIQEKKRGLRSLEEVNGPTEDTRRPKT